MPLTRKARQQASRAGPIHSRRSTSRTFSLPKPRQTQQQVRYNGNTSTYQCPFGSLVRFPHGSESNDVHAPVQEAHQRTDEGRQSCVPSHGVLGCGIDLENGQDSPAYLISKHEVKQTRATHDRSNTEMILNVFHSRITESMKPSQVRLRLS
jgi:hypothetical protein